MRFEVGDKIRIRENLVERGENGDFDDGVGYNELMGEFAGRTMTVKHILEKLWTHLLVILFPFISER